MGIRGSEASVSRSSTSKRAPKACESCRTRKVRCDVTRTKAPCTNCRLDDKQCVVPTSKRRHVGDRVLWSSQMESSHNPLVPICDAIIDFGDIQKSPSSEQSRDSVVDSSAFCVNNTMFDEQDVDIFTWSSSSKYPVPDSIGSSEQEPTIFGPLDDQAIKVEFNAPYPSPTQTSTGEQWPEQSLPSFIATLPEGLPVEDLNHMQQRGCFDLPGAHSRDELLRCYAKWIHPFLPMLDLTHILTAVASDSSTMSPISLLLFQSIMLAASAFCDMELGIEDRNTTRRLMYERCKILYDLSVEPDQLSTLQSVILMSFWDGDTGKPRDSYYWIGIATLHANNIGLYQDPVLHSSNLHRQRILKRTWWSLLIRDRLLAVAMRRPVHNKISTTGVPMLRAEDFENKSLISAMQVVLGIDDINLETLDVTASSCVSLAQLTDYIDKILTLQYSVRRAPGTRKQHTEVVSLVPKTSGVNWAEIHQFGQELQYWYGFLRLEVQRSVENTPTPLSLESDMANVHRSLLAAYYSMTLMTLYRPLLSLTSRDEGEKMVPKLAMKIVFQAARNITKTYGTLYGKQQLSCLPDTAVVALEPALVTHLLYSMSNIAKIRDTSVQQFYLCWRILLQLGDTHSLANTTIVMINAAAKKLKAQERGERDEQAESAELVAEIRRLNARKSTPRTALPSVDTIGIQVNQGAPPLWDQTMYVEPDSMVVDQIAKFDDQSVGGEADLKYGSEADLFEQLVCWEEDEKDLQM